MSVHTIERLGHLGDGIAPGPVYVARALPGETVEGEPEAGRIARPRILAPSPERVAPPCPHYAGCGGCALMHASDAFVAGWKVEVVRQALAAHDLSAPVAAIATSPPSSRRRAVLSGRRTKKGALVGFHARASDTLSHIEHCRVLVPQIPAALPILEAMVMAGGSRKGELSLHVTHGPDGLDVAVTGGKPLDAALTGRLAAIADAGGLARLTWGDEPVALARPPRQPMGPALVVPPPGAFLQATAHGEAALLARVTDAVGDAARIVDLFAGCGTFALPLARHAEVHAVEGQVALTGATLAGWRGAAGVRPLTAETRDLFRRPLLPAELGRFDAAVIDPPRAGAEAQMREIAASGLSRVGAVSCNPTTFARDAAILVAAGFTIDRIDVIDQFRWSPHVELVAALSR